MKETKIAKENISWHKPWFRISIKRCPKCNEHKQTCQRWLEFLEKFPKHILLSMLDGNRTEMILNKLKDDKITDLKQAIKIYENNGI